MPALDATVLTALQSSYALAASEPWHLLLRRLQHDTGFSFHTVLAPDAYGVEIARRALADWLQTQQRRPMLTLSLKVGEPPERLTEALLGGLTGEMACVWVQAETLDPATDATAFVHRLWTPAIAILNARRNSLQRHLTVPLILAGSFQLQAVVREHAPDLWSIRHSVTYLDPPGVARSAQASPQFSSDPAPGGDPHFTLAEAAKLADDPLQALARATLLHRAGGQFQNRQHWQQAEIALLDALQIRRTLHADPDEIAGTLNQLGTLFYEMGQYSRAEHYFRQTYEQTILAHGAEHPATSASRNNLAEALRVQGKYAEAEQEHRAVLAIRERVLGAEHPDTLQSRNNLAATLLDQGKSAEEEHRAVLAIMERVQGAEHPDTLTSRNNLANALRAQGKNAEAEKEHRAVLAICERVLGAEHPDTLASRNNLAAALQDQGKNAEAEQEHRAVLAIMERVQGAEHPATLTSRNNLAEALRVQGKNAEAEKEHRAVLAIRERMLGAEHPDVFQSYFNLAWCLEAQKKGPEALGFARRALEGWRKVLGEEHDYTKRTQRMVDRLAGVK